MHCVATRRMHFDPLSLLVEVENFRYNTHKDEENGLGPVSLNGSTGGNGAHEAMRGSLQARGHVQMPEIDYGSTRAIRTKPVRDREYGSPRPIRMELVRLGRGAFVQTQAHEGYS